MAAVISEPHQPGKVNYLVASSANATLGQLSKACGNSESGQFRLPATNTHEPTIFHRQRLRMGSGTDQDDDGVSVTFGNHERPGSIGGTHT